LRPVALAAVLAARRATQLPIVGMGGVETGRHVLELIACGATHVALGTVLFADPDGPARVRTELAEELKMHGFDSASDAFGVAVDSVVLAVNSAKR
jgi:dihydroorotate dehydrogenase (NAD+) catalytic subunit